MHPPLDDNYLSRNTVLTSIAVVILCYFGIGIAFGFQVAIEAFNVPVLAFASGCLVAYGPDVWAALRKRYIPGGDVLIIAIWIAWAAVTIARVGSILWRLSGKPIDWLDNPLWEMHIALSTVAALGHMVAPEAVRGRVPSRIMARAGFWTAGAVTILTLIAMAIDAFSPN